MESLKKVNAFLKQAPKIRIWIDKKMMQKRNLQVLLFNNNESGFLNISICELIYREYFKIVQWCY